MLRLELSQARDEHPGRNGRVWVQRLHACTSRPVQEIYRVCALAAAPRDRAVAPSTDGIPAGGASETVVPAGRLVVESFKTRDLRATQELELAAGEERELVLDDPR